jgi:hypothetical protein
MRTYFLHVPKSGGTSVRALFLQRFGADLCPHQGLDGLVSEPGAVDRYAAFCGHFGGDFIDALCPAARVFTVLRDPVVRTVSHYLHVRHDTNHPFHRYVQGQNLRAFCDDPVTFPLIYNFQARYLARTGISPLIWGADLSPDQHARSYLSVLWEGATVAIPEDTLLEQAEQTLRTADLVGVTERMPAFWERCAALLGMTPPPMARVNVTDATLDSAELDDCLVAHIRRLTALDAELYALACEIGV